jgi:Papain family cysteine protease
VDGCVGACLVAPTPWRVRSPKNLVLDGVGVCGRESLSSSMVCVVPVPTLCCAVLRCAALCSPKVTLDAVEKIPPLNETAMMQAVAQHPIAVGVCCGDYIDAWHAYAGGVFDAECCEEPIDHAMVVVGECSRNDVHSRSGMLTDGSMCGFGGGPRKARPCDAAPRVCQFSEAPPPPLHACTTPSYSACCLTA